MEGEDSRQDQNEVKPKNEPGTLELHIKNQASV